MLLDQNARITFFEMDGDGRLIYEYTLPQYASEHVYVDIVQGTIRTNAVSPVKLQPSTRKLFEKALGPQNTAWLHYMSAT